MTSFVCTSAKVDLLFGRHNFAASGGNTFKLALYAAASTISASTTAYTASNEAAVGGGGSGYTAGGAALTNVDPTASSTTALLDFSDLVFTLSGGSATLTAAKFLIYNDTLTTPVADASFIGGSFTEATASGAGATFTIQFPTPDASNAIFRIA
jgi:hypothetical protein